jgi:hypothetical protein
MTLCWTLVLILLALLFGIFLGYRHTEESECQLRMRIKELGDKSTQLLLFLSFAIAAVVVLGYGNDPGHSSQVAQKIVQGGAMRWWVFAIFPVVVGILPLKEFWRIYDDKLRWYRTVRWLKFWLLWIAIFYIIMGAIQFCRAI